MKTKVIEKFRFGHFVQVLTEANMEGSELLQELPVLTDKHIKKLFGRLPKERDDGYTDSIVVMFLPSYEVLNPKIKPWTIYKREGEYRLGGYKDNPLTSALIYEILLFIKNETP